MIAVRDLRFAAPIESRSVITALSPPQVGTDLAPIESALASALPDVLGASVEVR